MKKNSNIILRIPDRDRDELQDHARKMGLTLSDLLRSLAKREMRQGDLARDLKPEPVEDRCRTTRRIRDLDGRDWYVQLQTDGLFAYLILREELDSSADYRPLQPRDLPAASCGPFLDLYRKTGSREFEWTDPAFQEMCRLLEIDISRMIPRYRDEDADLVASLKRLVDRDPASLDACTAVHILRLLRIDRPQSINDWRHVMEDGAFSLRRRSNPLLRRAARRIPEPRSTSPYEDIIPIQLLPSPAGLGSLASFYTGVSYSDIDPRTVAVLPAMNRLRKRLVVRELKAAGVRFLREDEVPAYMQAEGEAWRDRLLDYPGPIKRAWRRLRRSLRAFRNSLRVSCTQYQTSHLQYQKDI